MARMNYGKRFGSGMSMGATHVFVSGKKRTKLQPTGPGKQAQARMKALARLEANPPKPGSPEAQWLARMTKRHAR
jgi:hypothetical protein